MGNFVEGVVHDTDKNGQGNEEGRDEDYEEGRDEDYEKGRDEDYEEGRDEEGHEENRHEEGDEKDRCNWKTCEAARLPWISREDQRRIEEAQVDQEQGWQSCERGDEQGWQKKLCTYSWMDECRAEGSRRLEG